MKAKTLVVTPTEDVRTAIARGGVVFHPGRKTTVHVFSQPDYLQIKSCRFLRILKEAPIGAVPDEDDVPDAGNGDGEKDSPGKDAPDIDLGKLSPAELRGMAVAANIELPKRATKKSIIAALEDAYSVAGETDEHDSDGEKGDGESPRVVTGWADTEVDVERVLEEAMEAAGDAELVWEQVPAAEGLEILADLHDAEAEPDEELAQWLVDHPEGWLVIGIPPELKGDD